MVEIIAVPPPVVPMVWPTASDLLKEAIAMSRGCFLPEDVFALCASGRMHLWLASEGEDVLAAYVTEIATYPRKRRIRAAFAGGKPHTMGKWLEPMVSAIDAYAKRIGLDGIEAIGRKGWTKFVEGDEAGTWLCRDYAPMELH